MSDELLTMRVQVVPEDRLAARGAEYAAGVLRAAVAARGRATVAFSGGSTAGPLLAALAEADVPWSALHVLQVDERVAPDGHPDRNLTLLRRHLLDHVPVPADALHTMPVDEVDLDAAAARYTDVLLDLAGRPPRLDLVHLGIGTDGHTASLVPGSPLLELTREPVAVTAPYQGRSRMTLTLPVLSRARRVLWFVRGAAKARMVRRLVEGDTSIPAARVEASRALLLLDPAAAAALPAQVTSEGGE
jgi:6-phosphogluconolactonase